MKQTCAHTPSLTLFKCMCVHVDTRYWLSEMLSLIGGTKSSVTWP